MHSGPLYKSCQQCPIESKMVTLEVISYQRLMMGKKTFKKSSLKPWAQQLIFSMLQCLVIPYINPANHTPGRDQI